MPSRITLAIPYQPTAVWTTAGPLPGTGDRRGDEPRASRHVLRSPDPASTVADRLTNAGDWGIAGVPRALKDGEQDTVYINREHVVMVEDIPERTEGS